MYSNGQYRKNYPNWHDEDASWKSEEILKLIAKNNLKPNTILDIGCGTGSILAKLSDKIKPQKAIGYEPFAEVIKIAKEKNPDLKVVDSLPEEKFDLALIIDVAEHVEDVGKFLGKVKRVAKYKIFHLPLTLSLQAKWRQTPISASRIRAGHLREFNKRTAIEFLKTNNFEILDVAYTAGTILSPVSSKKSRYLSLIRKLFFPLLPHLTSSTLGGYSLLILTK